MTELNELMQGDDWKTEKHVPVMDIEGKAAKGQPIKVNVGVGKEVSHPNTTQHHIKWISLFFLPEGEKIPYQLGDIVFAAHGSSVEGADTSTIYTDHQGSFVFSTEKDGTLLASSYCNIHGLWENSKQIKLN